MRWLRKKTWVVHDEYVELQMLLDNLKEAWDNYERYLNSLENVDLMEQWTYKVLLQKQLYRYVYRLVKNYYEGGGGVAKHVYRSSGDNKLDPSV